MPMGRVVSLRFFSIYIGKTGTAPLQLWFLMDQYNFNNLGRGSPNDHLCQIISNWASSFFDKKISYCFPYECIGKTNSTQWPPCFDGSSLVEVYPRTICAKLFSNHASSF